MASSSSERHKHCGSPSSARKLSVLILGSEWGSSKGGLSTINREFAIQLAKCSEVHVTFLVPHCNDEDKLAAHTHNIELQEAQQFDGMDELQWLSFPPHDLPIDVVIGHGVKLGPQADAIKRTRGDCIWVQVVHTTPEELGMHKEYSNPISSGQKKHDTEVKLCETADFVVTVGPKLKQAFCSYLSSCKREDNVFCFTPGIFSEFSNVVQVPERSGNFQVLLVGRRDPEDFQLKGFDIAAKAVATLTNTHLIFVGALEGEQEEIKKRFLDGGIAAEALRIRCFSNRECIKKMFYEVDLAIMPSRTEGFGLTGLEALSAGVPVLASQNSGFGQALRKVPFGSYSVVKSNEASVWSDAIKDVMEKNREVRLKESEALKAFYKEVYSWEKQVKELVGRMITLVQRKKQLGLKETKNTKKAGDDSRRCASSSFSQSTPLTPSNNINRNHTGSGVNQFPSGDLFNGGKDENCIVCTCGHPAKRFTVKRNTPNKGRQFYGCPNYNSNNGCKFFLLVDDSEKHASSSFSHTTPQTPSSNINRNRAGFNSGQNIYLLQESGAQFPRMDPTKVAHSTVVLSPENKAVVSLNGDTLQLVPLTDSRDTQVQQMVVSRRNESVDVAIKKVTPDGPAPQEHSKGFMFILCPSGDHLWPSSNVKLFMYRT